MKSGPADKKYPAGRGFLLLVAKIYSRSELGWKKISRAVAITGVHVRHVVTFFEKKGTGLPITIVLSRGLNL